MGGMLFEAITKRRRTDKYALNEIASASKVLFRRCANRFLFLVEVFFFFIFAFVFALATLLMFMMYVILYTKESIKIKHHNRSVL